MKGFALLVAALAGAALLYVTTAGGSQQAGPTRAEFNALKKQVESNRHALADDVGNHTAGQNSDLCRSRVSAVSMATSASRSAGASHLASCGRSLSTA